MSSTLREWRTDLLRRPVLVGMIGAGVILGISGPFDTLRQLTLVPRLLYWVFVVCATFSLRTLVIILIAKLTPRLGPLRRMIFTVPSVGLVVTVFLTAINAAVFAVWPDTIGDVIELFVIVMAIAAVIEVASGLLQSATPKDMPDILARLPLDKRGTLVAMTATDHYVDVVTTRGHALVLIRLSDAIKEAGIDGLQVHRSHWVARDQVTASRRENGRAILTMSHGAEIPVSRSYMPAVKAAGLLPLSRMDAP